MSERGTNRMKPVRQTRTERLNTALYKKMFAAQEHYRAWLLGQPPEEILNHTYEYTMREDILLSLEYEDISAKRAAALLALSDPLDAVYQEYDRQLNSHIEDIFAAIEQCADDEIAERRRRRDGLER